MSETKPGAVPAERSLSRRLRRLFIALAAVVVTWLTIWPAALGGATSYVVVSGPSMEPTLQSGDLVVARARDDYDIGDVVVYNTGDGNVIHRIVGGDGESGFVMQGDNKDDIDPWTPTADQVIGEEAVNLPGVGKHVLRVRDVVLTPPMPYLIAGFVFLLIVLGKDEKKSDRASRGSRRSAKRAKSDEGTAQDSNNHGVELEPGVDQPGVEESTLTPAESRRPA